MKKLLLSTLVTVTALVAMNATAAYPSNTGPLTISWQVTTGSTNGLENITNKSTIIKKGTNAVGTNIVSTFKASSSTKTFNSTSLLDLLAVSLKDSSLTNKGNTLAISNANDTSVILVVNGTNVITNASSVLTVTVINSIAKGVGTETTLTEKSGTNVTTTYSGTESATYISFVKFAYDDSSVITNGTASTFKFNGVSMDVDDSTIKSNGSEVNTQNFNLTDGSGTGTISGETCIITGGISGGPIKTTGDNN